LRFRALLLRNRLSFRQHDLGDIARIPILRLPCVLDTEPMEGCWILIHCLEVTRSGAPSKITNVF